MKLKSSITISKGEMSDLQSKPPLNNTSKKIAKSIHQYETYQRKSDSRVIVRYTSLRYQIAIQQAASTQAKSKKNDVSIFIRNLLS